MAIEVSPLTEVAAAVGDEPSGPTSERGNDGRWTATATARLTFNRGGGGGGREGRRSWRQRSHL